MVDCNIRSSAVTPVSLEIYVNLLTTDGATRCEKATPTAQRALSLRDLLIDYEQADKPLGRASCVQMCSCENKVAATKLRSLSLYVVPIYYPIACRDAIVIVTWRSMGHSLKTIKSSSISCYQAELRNVLHATEIFWTVKPHITQLPLVNENCCT